MPEIYKKIAEAKKLIRNTKVKKAGYNEFSKYDYFLPEQINEMVADVCEKTGLDTKFDLTRDKHGIYGTLQIIDIETGEKSEYMMATEIPIITATNAAQQSGGLMTFTHRYLKMAAFDISDNTLDFDTETKKKSKTEKKEYSESSNLTPDGKEKVWLKKGTIGFDNAVQALKDGKDMKHIRSLCKVSKEVETLLNTASNKTT